MKQHKWHKEIKAWADGAEIEYRELGWEEWVVWGVWNDNDDPHWDNYDYEFRIKPTPKEPKYLYAYYLHGIGETHWFDCEQEHGTFTQYLGKIKLEE
jgi:hypothetical protein